MAAAIGLAGCSTVQKDCVEEVSPGQGLWLRRDGRDVLKRFSGTEPVTFPEFNSCATQGFEDYRPFRVASISKLAVAETARAMERAGTLSLDADVSDALGMRFRHPAHPGAPVTLRHLLSHLSGIRDPEEYWVAAPGNIRAILTPDIWASDAEPGRFFRYSNLNYGVAATVMEAVSNTRFDALVHSALRPVPAMGFNWADMWDMGQGFGGAVVAGAALWRGGPGAWEAQVDGAAARAEVEMSGQPLILVEEGVSRGEYLQTYTPGTNGTLFSPQGGLRASFADLMAMGEAWLLDPELDVLWDAATDPGDTMGGHFVQFGLGRYIYPADRSPLPGVKLVGHVGEAYGFHGGLWAAPELGAVMVFGDLGSPHEGVPMTGGRPNLRETNAAYFRQIAQALGI